MLDEAKCWEAVVARDRSRDGQFYFGVVTTGVFCRPSCAARQPLRKNVRFYPTPAEAERDGLRPCLRCRPLAAAEASPAARMAELCDFIRRHCESGEPLTLEALGREAGMSPSHLQRTFRAVVGVTPRQFVEACRLDALKRQLRQGESVTQAIYDAGFGSASRVYERVDSRLGMTPSEYRALGRDVAISYASVAGPIGLLMVGATDRGLCFVQFGDSREELLERLRKEYPKAQLQPLAEPYSRPFAEWMEALGRHLDGKQPHLDLPLAVRASAFQHEVWRYLQSIPYGEVRSYAEVAEAIGRPKAARAVARACASNHTALVIPCHRVLRANGDLGGYRWGVERKRQLLDQERATS
jgi:AraC family transcriptional regulator of adaptative response/methylated-DNA-[protein]-cysteine methyltransferase